MQTTILMKDGSGVVIGGLIREENIHDRAMVPGFSKIPLLGHLFKRRADLCRRNELVVALVTHVISEGCPPRSHETMELQRTLPDNSAAELSPHPESIMHFEGPTTHVIHD